MYTSSIITVLAWLQGFNESCKILYSLFWHLFEYILRWINHGYKGYQQIYTCVAYRANTKNMIQKPLLKQKNECVFMHVLLCLPLCAFTYSCSSPCMHKMISIERVWLQQVCTYKRHKCGCSTPQTHHIHSGYTCKVFEE